MKQGGEKGLKTGIRRELLQGNVRFLPTTGENWLRFSQFLPAPALWGEKQIFQARQVPKLHLERRGGRVCPAECSDPP